MRFGTVVVVALATIVGFCAIRCALAGDWAEAVAGLGFVATALVSMSGASRKGGR